MLHIKNPDVAAALIVIAVLIWIALLVYVIIKARHNINHAVDNMRPRVPPSEHDPAADETALWDEYAAYTPPNGDRRFESWE